MVNRSTKTETIVGHFLFKDSKSLIIKKFKTKFGGLLNNFDICPKGLRISAINDKESDFSPWETQSLKKRRHQIKLNSVCIVHQKKLIKQRN